ncbi:hypothetical protein L0665_09795 [Methanogenium marinum]|uniref:Uncharacterized protein n=1 Tax=Methanogenium marinum TaxID=348610 RepID=A0A9Q4KQY3_9EURY|nr:hypothetical protein [Methanogenium marinum]MDE4908898.1 hypothetical protein [Methanogenium marinum]
MLPDSGIIYLSISGFFRDHIRWGVIAHGYGQCLSTEGGVNESGNGTTIIREDACARRFGIKEFFL